LIKQGFAGNENGIPREKQAPAREKHHLRAQVILKKERGKPQPFDDLAFPPLCSKKPDTELLLFPGRDCLDRALFRAGAAIRTQFGIDDILVIPLADRLHRTFVLTGTASNAFIGNEIRHIFLLC
jgi:hypothetical protein